MIKCPVCGNDIPSTYCIYCETNLIEINGQYYSEGVYKAAIDLKKVLDIYRQSNIQVENVAKKAQSHQFLAFKNHPQYYNHLEVTIKGCVQTINSMDITRKDLEKVFYDDFYHYAITTCNNLFGDTEQMMLELFDLLENIFKNIEYVISRISEVLKNDSICDALFLKYDVSNLLENEKQKIINHKKLENDRLTKSSESKEIFEFDIKPENLELKNFRKLDI